MRIVLARASAAGRAKILKPARVLRELNPESGRAAEFFAYTVVPKSQ